MKQRVPFVDLKAQYASIKVEVDDAIQQIINSTAFIGGQAVADFENGFSSFCGAENCIGVGNGTDALFIAMKCLGIGRGDEVIVPANSFIASSEAVTQTGAQVVFCDVDPSRYTVDPVCVESKITDKTRAIIAVHLYGTPVDMDPICALAKKHKLFVIEDAAQAHGATYNGRTVGALGDVACFSFYPGKNLGAYGDGGAIVTQDRVMAEKMRMFKNHGRTDKYDHEFEGVNSRLDGLQAAVLSVKLKHLQKWSDTRLSHARRYNKLLESVDGIICPLIPSDSSPVFHLYVIRTDKRDELQQYLLGEGIACGIHYPTALPNLTAYQYLGHSKADFPVASAYESQILSLPIYPEMTEDEIDAVSSTVTRFFS